MITGKPFPTGIDRVGLEYVNHYGDSSLAVFHLKKRYFFIKAPASKQLFKMILEWRNHHSKLNLLKFFIKMISSIDWRIDYSNKIILNTAHNSFELNEKFKTIKSIFMLHDLIAIEYPEYARPLSSRYTLNITKLNTLTGCYSLILCNSKHTENQLKYYAQLNNINLPPTKVTLLGTNLTATDHKKLPILPKKYTSRAYFIILGTIEPRKNHIMLLNIWRQLLIIPENKENVPNLLIIGRRGWRCSNVTEMLDDCLTIQNHVFELASCNDLELQAYLMNARALLLPSIAEGFGFPLIEALNLGIPVIASNIPPFYEIAGQVPEYIDPLDALTWQKVILDYTQSDCPSPV